MAGTAINRPATALAFALACGLATSAARAGGAPTLIDQNGARVGLADPAGRPAFVTFVATRCSDACPIADAAFARLASRLRRDRIDARLLTITLDPDYDTPFVMAGAARRIGARSRTWRFCSGTPADVRRVMARFGVVARRGADGVPDVHSSYVYLVDGRGRLVRTILLSTTLAADAERALALR